MVKKNKEELWGNIKARKSTLNLLRELKVHPRQSDEDMILVLISEHDEREKEEGRS